MKKDEKGTPLTTPNKTSKTIMLKGAITFFGIGGGLFFWIGFRQLRCESQEKNIMPCNTVSPVALVRHDGPILWLLMLKHYGCFATYAFVSATLVMPGNLPTKQTIQQKSRKKSLPIHSGCIKPCNLSNNLDWFSFISINSTTPKMTVRSGSSTRHLAGCRRFLGTKKGQKSTYAHGTMWWKIECSCAAMSRYAIYMYLHLLFV